MQRQADAFTTMKEVDEDDDDTSWAKRASFTVDDPLEILYPSDWQAESDAGQLAGHVPALIRDLLDIISRAVGRKEIPLPPAPAPSAMEASEEAARVKRHVVALSSTSASRLPGLMSGPQRPQRTTLQAGTPLGFGCSRVSSRAKASPSSPALSVAPDRCQKPTTGQHLGQPASKAAPQTEDRDLVNPVFHPGERLGSATPVYSLWPPHFPPITLPWASLSSQTAHGAVARALHCCR
ncbi:Hypothetical protein SMAX5B_007650 [Scophthalmus maximus]|uniref:Uncharacterized protein n=1 Tax=Scophthalmus maximus TaxID=52904 RepID=A0A2U9CKD6_SCOMX|nr:Hypothetical protein SMAX5B_007650 [Scophthalmus maximus]